MVRLPTNPLSAAPVAKSAAGGDNPFSQMTEQTNEQQPAKGQTAVVNSESQCHCSRCGRSADAKDDIYEYFAYRRSRTRVGIGNVYLLQQTTTHEGLVDMNGHACKNCVRDIQTKYKLVWLVGLFMMVVIGVATYLLSPTTLKNGWDEPRMWVPFIGIISEGFVFGTLGIAFPLFRWCIGQRIVIAANRTALYKLGLTKIVGGRFYGSDTQQQHFTRLIFE
jgi:hypothetical protein